MSGNDTSVSWPCQVKEKLDPDLEDVEIDHERKHYEAAGSVVHC